MRRRFIGTGSSEGERCVALGLLIKHGRQPRSHRRSYVGQFNAHRRQSERPHYAPRFVAARRDYLAQEARNRSLGRAGELFVVELEARRLHANFARSDWLTASSTSPPHAVTALGITRCRSRTTVASG